MLVGAWHLMIIPSHRVQPELASLSKTKLEVLVTCAVLACLLAAVVNEGRDETTPIKPSHVFLSFSELVVRRIFHFTFLFYP